MCEWPLIDLSFIYLSTDYFSAVTTLPIFYSPFFHPRIRKVTKFKVQIVIFHQDDFILHVLFKIHQKLTRFCKIHQIFVFLGSISEFEMLPRAAACRLRADRLHPKPHLQNQGDI